MTTISRPLLPTEPPGSTSETQRTIGLLGATTVGMGAIVGGGILVLAGAAFQATGPSALLAFGFHGVIAVFTALSFAEMATQFPESGGAYNFAKRILSVRSAFAVGWVLWFAYIVAGVLYAFGFASYGVELIRILFFPEGAPLWLEGRAPLVVLALIPSIFYSAALIRRASGGGEWATWGKLLAFCLILAAGFWKVSTLEFSAATSQLKPFFPEGFSGLAQAMGLTFIALQGFDLIAAIAGEVKNPTYTIPRAMLLSLAAALAVYLPLLLVVTIAGPEAGQSIQQMSLDHPETIMARAASNIMGAAGYWIVMVAALLSTLSALRANLLAASRVAQSMAADRTLPAILGVLHPRLKTPQMAIYASALALVALLLAVPNLNAAGTAASLVFLIAFALAHGTSLLARKRGEERKSHLPRVANQQPAALQSAYFKSPFFPLVPVVGGVACATMAIYQAVIAPSAGGIVLVWLGFGGLLYASLFSDRAEVFDAFAEAQDPTLARTRGRSPLVLVPVANPKSAEGMVEVAAALAPARVGRVLLLRVIPPPDEEAPSSLHLQDAQLVMTQALTTALKSGHRPEGLVTIAEKPWAEIGRVVRSHDCGGVVLGLPGIAAQRQGGHFERLLNDLDCDFTFVRCSQGWSPRQAERILVPVGRRGHDLTMRARVLGSLQTVRSPEVTWVTVISEGASDTEEAQVRRNLLALAQDNMYGSPTLMVERSDQPTERIAQIAAQHDLLVLELHRTANGQRGFGDFNSSLLEKTTTATLVIGSGR